MNDNSIIVVKAEELRQLIREEMQAATQKKISPDFAEDKMTVGQAANYIDINYITVCKWIKAGKIPVHGQGRTRFILKSELISALKNEADK